MCADADDCIKDGIYLAMLLSRSVESFTLSQPIPYRLREPHAVPSHKIRECKVSLASSRAVVLELDGMGKRSVLARFDCVKFQSLVSFRGRNHEISRSQEHFTAVDLLRFTHVGIVAAMQKYLDIP